MNLKLWMRWIKSVLNPDAARVRVVARKPLWVEGLTDRVNPCALGTAFDDFAGRVADGPSEMRMRPFDNPFDRGGFGFFGGRPGAEAPATEATHFDVRLASAAYAGEETELVVTARDAANRPVPGYTGTVHFESTDATAEVPADYTFTAADRGRHVFEVTPGETGELTVTVTQMEATTPDPTPDEPAAETAMMDLIVGEDATGKTPADEVVDTPADDGVVGKPADPIDETPVDEVPVEETPTDPVDETPVDETPVDEVPVDETPTDPMDETPVEEVPVDEAPVDDTPTDPVDEVPVDEVPVDEVPVDEVPTDPVDETPVDETPVDEVPTDETPVEETPTDPVDETPVPVDVSGAITFDVAEAPVATHFELRALRGATVGGPARFVVVPLDGANEPVTHYTGTVHFTSTDADAVLPADYTFTEADRGIHVFAAEFQAAGGPTLTATDADGATTGAVTVRVSADGDFGGRGFRARMGWWRRG